MNINLTTHIYVRAAKANTAGHYPIYVRITVNGRTKAIKGTGALKVLKYSFNFLYWLTRLYARRTPPTISFDEDIIPRGEVADIKAQKIQELQQAHEQARLDAEAAYKAEQKALQHNDKLRQQLEEAQAALAARKEVREQELAAVPSPPALVSEMETRRFLIDLYLREAG